MGQPGILICQSSTPMLDGHIDLGIGIRTHRKLKPDDLIRGSRGFMFLVAAFISIFEALHRIWAGPTRT